MSPFLAASIRTKVYECPILALVGHSCRRPLFRILSRVPVAIWPPTYKSRLRWRDRKLAANNPHIQRIPHMITKPCAPNLPESRGERFLFHGQPNLSPIFREMFCAHFSWKLKDENRRRISPFFRRIFRPHVGEKFRQNFALGVFWHDHKASFWDPVAVISRDPVGCRKTGSHLDLGHDPHLGLRRPILGSSVWTSFRQLTAH